MKRQLIDRLHAERCSCVIHNNDATRIFHERGVKDLHRLLHTEPALLDGAMIADKVVGKGAAALMVAGGARWVYAKVISQAALQLLEQYGIEVEAGNVVPHIINRAGTDICPVEKLCTPCHTIEECLEKIDEFVRSIARSA